MASAPSPYNPYRHLARALHAQLRLEDSMRAEDRINISWMVRVEFCGESMTLGKGGVNTCFWFRNQSERKMGYPNEALALLSRLGKQAHVLYRVVYATGKARRFATMAAALECVPEKGASIVGLTASGEEDNLRVAKRNVAGKLAWIARK